MKPIQDMPQISPVHIAGRIATRQYLSNYTPADYQKFVDLWDTQSGYKGLLNATRKPQAGTRYTYDPEKEQYAQVGGGRKGSRVMTRDNIRTGVRRVSTYTRNEMRKTTAQLLAGTIILAVWYDRTRDLIRSLSNTIWLTSIGGLLFDDNTARNLFYVVMMLPQYDYLDNFALQLSTGVQPLSGRALARAGQYGEWGNGFYENLYLKRALSNGYNEGRRVLGDNENHCHTGQDTFFRFGRPGCIELARIGWRPLFEVTPIGDAQCYDNCHCRIEVRRSA